MTEGKSSIASVGYQAELLSAHSGMFLLDRALNAHRIELPNAWETLSKRSWRGGKVLNRLASQYYGSTWSGLIPFLSDVQLSKKIDSLPEIETLLVLWGEFFTPRHKSMYKKYKRLACFHATAWRQPQVLAKFNNFDFYDAVVLMSESQRPFVESKGYPSEKIHTILHGVDSSYWHPNGEKEFREGPIQAMIVGGTERDHQFLAKLLKALPDGVIKVSACIPSGQHINYDDCPHIKLLPRLSDDALLRSYQETELMIIPMVDCTANNVVLESMACATPTLINDVGGVTEYLTDETSFIMPNKDTDGWAQKLQEIVADKEMLRPKALAGRERAVKLDWSTVALEYLALIETL